VRLRVCTILLLLLLSLVLLARPHAVSSCVIAVAIVLTYGLTIKLGGSGRLGEGQAADPVRGAVIALAVPIFGSLVFLWSLAVEWPFLWSLATWLAILGSGQAWAALAASWERKHKEASAAPVPRPS
jgi:hypothetical protein